MNKPSSVIGAALLATLLGLGGCAPGESGSASSKASSGAGEGAVQASFATPDEALQAFVAALEKDDASELAQLLGPGTEQLLSSGDAVEDRSQREAFLARYRTYHELVAGDANNLVLLAGEDRWPLPIPLKRSDGRWRFDGAAGAQELVLRRIGANELHTIDVMQGVVEAQADYAAHAHDGQKAGIYAQKLRSTPGKHDGLYWEVATGQLQSPAGPLLAAATAEGYGSPTAQPSHDPYHGYLFRLLTAQGPHAEGGAVDYLTDGRLTKGFAVIAWPASYGASGIMTFMVNQDGVVWQRDLGQDTAEAAADIKEFDPDEAWTPLAPEE